MTFERNLSEITGPLFRCRPMLIRGIRFFVGMMSRTGVGTIVIAAAILHIGCEENNLDTLDFAGLPPSISSGQISPDSLNVDLLQPSGDIYSVTTTIRSIASDPDGAHTLSSVTAEIFRPRATSGLVQVTLRDDGIAPDLVAGDLEFAANATFTLNRAQTGTYRIQVTARDRNNLRSNTCEIPFVLTRNNSAPFLDGQTLLAPDTVTRPATGSSTFFVSIAASDADGIQDIREVYLLNLQTQNRTFLLDDGGVPPPGGVSSGDLLAGDGVFSVTLQLPSTIPPGLYPFLLQATDSFRDTSNSVSYTLIVE